MYPSSQIHADCYSTLIGYAVAQPLRLAKCIASCIADWRTPPAAQARELQAALRGEATQLETFIPVLIQGAASGIADALKQQVCESAQRRKLDALLAGTGMDSKTAPSRASSVPPEYVRVWQYGDSP